MTTRIHASIESNKLMITVRKLIKAGTYRSLSHAVEEGFKLLVEKKGR